MEIYYNALMVLVYVLSLFCSISVNFLFHCTPIYYVIHWKNRALALM